MPEDVSEAASADVVNAPLGAETGLRLQPDRLFAGQASSRLHQGCQAKDHVMEKRHRLFDHDRANEVGYSAAFYRLVGRAGRVDAGG